MTADVLVAPVSDAAAADLPSWRLLLRRPAFIIGAVILLFWIVCALFGSSIAPHDPHAQQLLFANNPPSGEYWFGTDQLGRDVFSRVIVGSRSILVVAPRRRCSAPCSAPRSGSRSGYLGGVLDTLVGRLVEAVLAIPTVIVAFLFIVAIGASTWSVILVIGFIFTPLIARTVRTTVLVESQLDYVPAARLLGEEPARVMFAEILPNVHADRPGRVLRTARVRHLHGRHAGLPRFRHGHVRAELGIGHQRQLRRDRGRLLVGDPVPRARDRLPDRRHQPGDRLGRAGAGRMTEMLP